MLDKVMINRKAMHSTAQHSTAQHSTAQHSKPNFRLENPFFGDLSPLPVSAFADNFTFKSNDFSPISTTVDKKSQTCQVYDLAGLLSCQKFAAQNHIGGNYA
ncbi:hypothetical protein LP093_13995 (plasmid) [Moraxella bovis]|uniref:hypothetical protein n=1 Tax=Moraxella bovis TaxID=476 RepID=UPI002227FBEA|nr:hypothetical protein [Moraxella bovis]UYZ77105.1 hypothetical protein LP093_13995 [Moraxella bovis]